MKRLSMMASVYIGGYYTVKFEKASRATFVDYRTLIREEFIPTEPSTLVNEDEELEVVEDQ